MSSYPRAKSEDFRSEIPQRLQKSDCILPKPGHHSPRMDGLPLTAKILKSLIAPAKHSDGPTLYLICSEDEHHVIYEQMPDGTCQAWPDGFQGVHQAEGMIYQRGVDGR